MLTKQQMYERLKELGCSDKPKYVFDKLKFNKHQKEVMQLHIDLAREQGISIGHDQGYKSIQEAIKQLLNIDQI